jgi:hypothetical protein
MTAAAVATIIFLLLPCSFRRPWETLGEIRSFGGLAISCGVVVALANKSHDHILFLHFIVKMRTIDQTNSE